MSNLLAATALEHTTWLQKLNMFSLSDLVTASIRFNDFAVDTSNSNASDSNASDPSHCILNACVNAALQSEITKLPNCCPKKKN